MDVSGYVSPINKNRLHQEVIWRIKELIAQGCFKPGDKLPSNRELAEQFSVSRAVIAEAMALLEVMGIVKIKPGSGTYVNSLNKEGIEQEVLNFILTSKKYLLEDLNELRFILEPEIARLAAEKRNDPDIEKMRSVLQRMEEKAAKDENVTDESMNFHLLLAKAAQNQIIVRILVYLHIILRESRDASLKRKERPKLAVKEHMAILDAVIEKDGEKAKKLMKKHLEELPRFL
ncbi:MAG: FadR/GntR family transcriptional regulator [Peptococcaceae bacterium]|nr:FadR family transcriptional regulator [Peptococcaceae bacterium]MDH7524870.1 FadR/GntR family transcriptional regulator [Peptococcaceae bacterium]